MWSYLLFLLLGPSVELSNEQAYQDSLFIYNTYKDNIQTLRETNDPNYWYRLEDTLSFSTACSFRRLTLYNKTSYKPVLVYDKRDFGIAPYYPAPSGIVSQIPDVSVNTDVLHAYRTTAYSVIGQETKFIADKNGKTIMPYIERVYYDVDNNIIKIVKLNPVTYLPINQSEGEPVLSFN